MAEQTDQASLAAAGLESSGKTRSENLSDPRMNKDEVQKAIRLIWRPDEKPAPSSETSSDSQH